VTVTWTITDLCETNYFDAKFIVTGDTVKPVITLPTDYEDYVCDVPVPGSLTATWTDNCMDGSRDVIAYAELTVDTTCGQTYTYVFEVEDACGNIAKDSLTISREYVSLEDCETAFARLPEDLPIANPNSFTDEIGARCFLEDGFERWGWVNRIYQDSTYYMPVYAGAGQCDISKGYHVGTAIVSFVGTNIHVDFDLFEPWVLSEAHIYAGVDMYPTMKNGKETVAPGQYNVVYEGAEPLTGFDLDISNASDYIYLIIHAVTCKPNCVCDGTVFDDGVLPSTSVRISTAKVKGPKKVETELEPLETEFKVYPNPFTDKVTFEFVSGVDAHGILEIYTLTGQRVVRLLDRNVVGGELNTIEFEPTETVSGVYLYRLDLDGEIKVGRLIYKE
jgi:hypothetical protein